MLCHFCETHGPAIIMCTQPLRQLVIPMVPSRKSSAGTPHASSSCGSFHVASTSASHEGTIWPAEQLTHNLFCKSLLDLTYSMLSEPSNDHSIRNQCKASNKTVNIDSCLFLPSLSGFFFLVTLRSQSGVPTPHLDVVSLLCTLLITFCYTLDQEQYHRLISRRISQ